MFAPRISAQPMARYEACHASYARELEMSWFSDDHGIEGLKKETPHADNAGYDDRGARLLPALAIVPFRSERFGLGFGDLAGGSTAIRQAIAQAGVSQRAGDEWFLTDSINRRDSLIEHMLERCEKERIQVESLEIVTGAQRLHVEMPLGDGANEWIAGNPGWLLLAKDASGNAVRALIVDYKQDLREVGMAQDNAELRTLAVLTAVNWPSVRDVTVAQVGRADLKPGEVSSYTFPIEDLGGAHFDRLAATMKAAIGLAEPFFDTGRAQPTPAHNAQLDGAANIGGQCGQCTGKCNCGKARSYLERERERLKQEEADDRKRASKLNPIAKKLEKAGILSEEEKTMTMDELVKAGEIVESVSEAMKLTTALKKDRDTIIRQLVAAGHSVPGYAVNEGNPTLSVKEKDGESISPAQAYEILSKRGLLPNVGEEDFVRVTASLSATRLRGLLADLHKIPESEVFSLKLKPLGEDNPLEAGSKAGTVVRVKTVVTEAPKVAAAAKPAEAPAPKEQPQQPKTSARKR